MNTPRFACPAIVAIIVLLSSFSQATASVAEGRAALARQTPADLQLAHQAFSTAVAADPYKFDLPARFLKVATALALEFGREEFLEEWRRLGITIVDPSIYSFHYELPVDADGVFQPAEGASTAQSLAYIIGRRAVLDEALAGLKEIDCPDFNLALTAAETSLLDVRIDLADVCLLRALLHAGQAAIFIAEGINGEADYALFHRLHAEGRLNPQQVLEELPALLRHTTKTSERDKARAELLSAYAEFRRAYDFIRLRRGPATGTPNLFEFADEEGAAVFAGQMEAVAESLAGTPVVLPAPPPGDTNLLGGQTLDLARFFSPSAPALRDLLPRYYDRGFFRRGSWPDLTLGGILPSATSELLDRLALEASVLQATLYHPYTFSLLVSSPPKPLPDEPPAPEPLVGEIGGLAIDPQGNLYVADNGFHVIRKVSPDGFITVVAGQKWQEWYERDELLRRAYAGQPSYFYSYTDSPSDIFDELRGIACDASGNVYFISGRRIMHLAPDGSLRALAGRSGYYSWWPEEAVDGTGSGAIFGYPSALACDAAGNIYVADETCIRKITSAGVVTTLAGVPDHLPDAEGLLDGLGNSARFSDWMTGIAVDDSGNIYVNDTGNNALRKIQPDGATTTLVHSGGLWRHYDAHASQAGLVWPEGLAVDGGGRLFFGDNNTVRSLSPDGRVLTHGGKPHSNGFVMGTGEGALFSGRSCVRLRHFAVDRRGTLYISNRRGDIVRAVPAVDLPPDGEPFPAPTPYPQPDPDAPQGPPWPLPPATQTPVAGSFGSFEFSESTAVLAGQERYITLSGTYRGDLRSLSVSLRSATYPSMSVSSSFNGPHDPHPTAPRDKDRVLSMVFVIPAYAASGQWAVEHAYASWADGTWESFSANGDPALPDALAGLSLTVDNTNPDLVRPQVLSVTAHPVFVNAMDQEQTIQVLVEVAADQSGIAYGHLSFRNLTGDGWHSPAAGFSSQDLFAVQVDSVVYRTFVTLPVGTMPADYGLTSLDLQDRAGNRINYIRNYADSEWYQSNPDYAPLPAQLETAVFSTGPQYPAHDFPGDSTPATVVDVEFVPEVIDVTSADAQVEVRVVVTDDFSGVNWINLNLEFNDGYHYDQAYVSDFRLVSGNALNGVYSGRLSLPRGSVPGQWRVSQIGIGDRNGNHADYFLWDGSLPALAASRRLTVVFNGERTVPRLQDVSVELPDGVTVLDTWAGEQSLSVKVAVTGVSWRLRQYWNSVGTVGLRSPSGTQYLWSDFQETHLVGVVGDEYHYEIIFRLPQWSEEGLWTFDYVELDDGNYQRSYYGPVELTNLGLDIPGFMVAGLPRWWEQGYVAPPAPPLDVALTFGDLNFIYNGAEHFGSATTELEGLNDYIVITYNGLTTAPILPGTYDVVARLVNDQYTGRQTGTMVIAAAPNAAYSDWAQAHNIDLLKEGAPGEDPDADGLSNAQEFAFGGSPNSSDGSLVGVSSEDGEFVMTWRQRQHGADYEVQWSPNLQTPFVSVESLGASTSVASEVEGYSETVTRMPMPPSGGGFYRIHATLTPPAP